ncbi:hypothetical protein DOJK_00218 [Patescibacteria group bacterium]|nr:hypothetical protein DOJK_00218 [Patescibacteria group bacterium]
MKTSISFLLIVLIFSFSIPVYAKKLYKTVDETGKVSFSDQIPPEDTKHQHETLTKDARVINVTEKEKSKEQQEREHLLQSLRKKQEKIIQKQKSHDEALLRSYHSKEEMERELKEKLQTIEGQKKLLEGEVVQHTERLDVTQKKAATYERNAQPIPKSILQDIKSIQADIDKTKENIKENLALQAKITDEYQTNMRRFLLLTQKPETEQKDKVSSIEEADAIGLFRCENDYQCKKAWEIAKTFVDSNSITPADINTENLVMHALPTKDGDFSLSIAKLSGRHDEIYLFLDAHCRESSLGEELCASKKMQELRSSFRSYVNERLSKLSPDTL